MLIQQRIWQGGGTLLCSINARVADELGLEEGDIIEFEILRVKSPGGEWEEIED